MYLLAARQSYLSLHSPPKTRFPEYGCLLLIGQFEEIKGMQSVTTLITAAKETRPPYAGDILKRNYHLSFCNLCLSRKTRARKSHDYGIATLKSKAGVVFKFRKFGRPNRRNKAAVFKCLRCNVNEQKSKMTDTKKKNLIIHPPASVVSPFSPT